MLALYKSALLSFFLFSLLLIGRSNSALSTTITRSIDIIETIEQIPLKSFPAHMGNTLRLLADKYRSYDAFGDEEACQQSTKNWQERCKLLKLAMAFGDKEALTLYEEDIESKMYSRDCADCLIAGYEQEYDIRRVRAFFWEHLAYEREEEKESLIKAYLEGKLVPFNEERARFWKTYAIEQVPFHITQ